jgi:GR25 family glycosyltransferase involved in LPS biosynthesis
MKSFVIFQNQIEMSVKFAQEAVSAAAKHGIDLRGWVGSDGLKDQHKFEQYGIKNFLQDKIEKLPGVKGCFLSHYELWKKCLDQGETFLICEHDGIFIRNLPDDIENNFTDVLNLDPYDQFVEGYDEKVKKSLNIPIKYHEVEPSDYDMAGGYLKGAYGYLIKPQGAEKLIKFAQEQGALPTDKHIGTAVVDIKVTNVPIVRLHEFFDMKNLRKFSLTKNLEKFSK